MSDPSPQVEQQHISANSDKNALQPSSVIGDLRLHRLRSKVFRNERMLRVWLPPGYDDAGNVQRYPVLYLNDGQNLFDRATAYTGVEWQADETVDRLLREGVIPPIVMVGIDNAAADRVKEYVPYRMFNPPVLRPLGRKYPEFLVDEVMPFVGQQYRVARGAANTGLGGSSLGGLIALFTAMVAPGVFGRLLVESPSLYMANRQVLREARTVREWPERIVVGVGTQETGRAEKDREIVEDVRNLERILQRAGLGEGRLRVRIEEGASHNEAAWAGRFGEALRFLFGA
ncbi:MAG TPA: alpha/beta hydrolase-fold protein [Terriglobales bacterium]|nr:alpha/beta hydrolase-fold protein [Terriglobales bacterium]